MIPMAYNIKWKAFSIFQKHMHDLAWTTSLISSFTALTRDDLVINCSSRNTPYCTPPRLWSNLFPLPGLSSSCLLSLYLSRFGFVKSKSVQVELIILSLFVSSTDFIHGVFITLYQLIVVCLLSLKSINYQKLSCKFPYSPALCPKTWVIASTHQRQFNTRICLTSHLDALGVRNTLQRIHSFQTGKIIGKFWMRSLIETQIQHKKLLTDMETYLILKSQESYHKRVNRD